MTAHKLPVIPVKFNAPACENRASARESHATVSAAHQTVVAKSERSEIGETPSRAFLPRGAVNGPPPSDEVQRRAWEAAYVLGDEFRPQVPRGSLWRVDAAFRAGPFRQSWPSVCFLFVLLGQVVEVRQ